MENKDSEKDRRPISSRNTSWANNAARLLQRKGATPNGISAASMAFAFLSGLSFFFAFRFFDFPVTSVFLFLGAVFIQCRLICNLLDGMVAVEGGMRTPTGAIFNDLPDRVSDSFILLGAGYSATLFPWAVELGWAAALLAALTAYIRILGGSCGLAQRFQGPMAKQHRMAILTASALIAAFLPVYWGQLLLTVALGIIALGSLITCFVRLCAVGKELNERG